MPFLASTLDNDDPLFALVVTRGFNLLHVEVAYQDQLVAVYKQTLIIIKIMHTFQKGQLCIHFRMRILNAKQTQRRRS